MSTRAGRLAGTHTVLIRLAAAVTALFIAVTVALMVTHTKLEPVLTGSMSPSIPQYSLVLATPVRSTDLRVGDVVVFQPPAGHLPAGSASVMHRVVELREEGGAAVMRTRGDANTALDPWTIDLRGSALYRVQAHLPHVGVALKFLHNTTRHTGGMLTWPGLLILIGVAGYAVRMRRRTAPAPVPPATEAPPLRQISQDLRNPLSSIVGYAELLADEALDPKHARVVETIARQARRLAGLADDISVLQSLQAEPAATTGTCLLAILHQTRDRLAGDLAARSVDLTFDVQGGDTGVFVDTRRFRHAFQALLHQMISTAAPGTLLQVAARRANDTFDITVTNSQGTDRSGAPASLAVAVAHRVLEPHLVRSPLTGAGADVALALQVPAISHT